MSTTHCENIVKFDIEYAALVGVCTVHLALFEHRSIPACTPLVQISAVLSRELMGSSALNGALVVH